LDADKEGFLRSRSSLIQVVGRAARNSDGRVIFYADRITDSMRACMDETDRRRTIQEAYNKEHNITPQTIIKSLPVSLRKLYGLDPEPEVPSATVDDLAAAGVASIEELGKLIATKQKEMKKLAAALEFEQAADLRDEINRLKGTMLAIGGDDSGLPSTPLTEGGSCGLISTLSCEKSCGNYHAILAVI
jgi:excinuclease ABC subunit B